MMSSRFYLVNSVALLLLALSIMLPMQALPAIDFTVSDWFYQKTSGFIYADHWLWRDYLHDDVRSWIKPAKVLLSAFLLAIMLWPTAHRFRGAAAYTLMTLSACNGVVSWLKGIAGRVCPAELSRYGGDYSWQPLFSSVLEKIGGHCWPGGHALHAFMLLPIGYAFILLQKPKSAAWAFALILSFGSLLSLTQIVRGQHFLSHQLATLFFCWATSFVGFMAAEKLVPRLVTPYLRTTASFRKIES